MKDLETGINTSNLNPEAITKMKTDRERKENATAVVRRSIQQLCSLIQDFCKSLDVRRKMNREQENALLQYQKIIKELFQKLFQLKQSDAQKQSAVEALKSELEGKDKILGIKAREISRLTSKLQAAESHVQYLNKTNTAAKETPVKAGKGVVKGEKAVDDQGHIVTIKVDI